jgi:asparagine N-glycosylation enzyme membrane subunit Stt3
MDTISTFLGFFNVCAGLLVVAAFLAFFGGFIRYLVVLGTERRKEGLKLMFWGITILFVLVVILGVINILEGPISFLIGVAIILFLCFVAVLSIGSKGGNAGARPEH